MEGYLKSADPEHFVKVSPVVDYLDDHGGVTYEHHALIFSLVSLMNNMKSHQSIEFLEIIKS